MATPKRSSLTHNEILTDISRETKLPKTVVKRIINRYIDICIEQLINEDDFSIPNLISSSPYKVKGGGNLFGKTTAVEQLRLKVKTSHAVKQLYRLQNDYFKDTPYMVNRNTWRGAFKWMMKEGRGALVKDPRTVIFKGNKDFDEDEEY